MSGYKNSHKIVLSVLIVFVYICTATAENRQADWPDPVANVVLPYQSSGLTHGPMLGRITSSGVRVWLRTAKPNEFKVVYGTKLPIDPNSNPVSGHTLAENDNTGYVDIKNLKPDTKYYYGIVTNGQLVDTRMVYEPGFTFFKTLPDETVYQGKYNPKGLFNFTFATAYGNRQAPSGHVYGNSPAYSTLIKNHLENLRFLIMNGDYIYEEVRYLDNIHRPENPQTQNEFRDDYKIYLSRGTDMARLFRYIPTLFTYDDHETYSDLEGTGEIGLQEGKWLYRDLSLIPWYEYSAWANYEGLHYQSIRTGSAIAEKGSNILYDPNGSFKSIKPKAVTNILTEIASDNAGTYAFEEVIDNEHLTISPVFRADERVKYSIGTHHYYDWKVGNCHFFALDTRGERTRYNPSKTRDPNQFILGPVQRKWLMDGIKNTDADFIFIVSSVSWTIYHTNFHTEEKEKLSAQGKSLKEDGFCGVVYERELLLDFFDELPKPVIILTGDLHNPFAVQISDNVWEFMVGPIGSKNHPIGSAGNPPYGGWFDSEGRKVKIKWMESFPNEITYHRLRNIYYGIVQINNVFRGGRKDQSGLNWIAYENPQVVVQFYDGYTGELLYAEGISTADIEQKKQ